MSATLKITNGQLDIDSSTGQLSTVTDNRKSAQDLAECLMQDYLADNDYGSYLRVLNLASVPYAGDLFVHHYIADAVQRLQQKQQNDPYVTPAELITGITQLLVKTDWQTGTTVFFLNTSTADGGEESVAAEQVTQLNQQYEKF